MEFIESGNSFAEITDKLTEVAEHIGASKNGKRAAIVHLYFNVIGTVVFFVFLLIFYLIPFSVINKFIHEPTFTDAEPPFIDVERTFSVGERRFLLGLNTFLRSY